MSQVYFATWLETGKVSLFVGSYGITQHTFCSYITSWVDLEMNNQLNISRNTAYIVGAHKYTKRWSETTIFFELFRIATVDLYLLPGLFCSAYSPIKTRSSTAVGL